MFQFKNKKSLAERLKDDKPIPKKNTIDFDDLDIESSFSFDESNENNDKNSENNKTENSEIFINSNNILLNNSLTKDDITPKEQDNCKNNENNNNLSNKNQNNNDNNNNNNNICLKDNDNDLYSDKEDSVKDGKEKNRDNNNEENNEKEKEIEREIVRSITKKERVTRERINMAELIRFRNEPESIVLTDQFGFIMIDKVDNAGISKKLTMKNNLKFSSKLLNKRQSIRNSLKVNARIEKWNHMLKNYEEFSTKKRDILKSRTRKGIPDNLRGYVWQLFAEKQKYFILGVYENLQNLPIDENLERVIIKDLNRTFPLCHFFREQYGNGQRKLYRVLSRYSLYNKSVGYVQGMGFLAAAFLMYMDEESSFFMIHSLMKKYKMEGIFLDGFPELKKLFFVLLKLQKKFINKIYDIIRRDKVIPTMYASNWFISLFTRSFEFPIAVRVLDCFLLEGFKAIYRFSLALLKIKENELYKCTEGSSITLLTHCAENTNIDELFKVAFGFSISTSYIQECEEEFEKVKNDEKNEFMSQLLW